MRRWVCLALLMLICPLGSLSAHEVLVDGAREEPGMRAFADALQARRPTDHVRFEAVTQLPRPAQLTPETRVILLDADALEWRLGEQAGPPALALRVSRVQAQRRLGTARPIFLSLLWSDPPLERQLRLIRYLLPSARRIGVLHGNDSGFLLAELTRAATPLNLEIVSQAWPQPSDNRPLQQVLAASDVLLGMDDPDVYNSTTAKNVLLSSYGRQRALIGPSAGFVRAGALATTYSDQQDWLSELDHLLDRSPNTWPRSHYPTHFGVLGNQQVARALGLGPIDTKAAELALAEEGTPP